MSDGLPVEGTLAHPLRLDPYQRVIEVHWGGDIVIAEFTEFPEGHINFQSLDPLPAIPLASATCPIGTDIPKKSYTDVMFFEPTPALPVIDPLGGVHWYFFDLERVPLPIPVLNNYVQTLGDAWVANRDGAWTGHWLDDPPGPPATIFEDSLGASLVTMGAILATYPALLPSYITMLNESAILPIFARWILFYQVANPVRKKSRIINMSKTKLVRVYQPPFIQAANYPLVLYLHLRMYSGGTFRVGPDQKIVNTNPDAQPKWQATKMVQGVPGGTVEIAKFNAKGLVVT